MRPRVQMPPPAPEYGQTQLVVRTGVIVTAVLATMFFGFWLTKAPCVLGDWDGKQYGSGLTNDPEPVDRERYFVLPCYTDIVPLWSSDRGGPDGQLIGERFDLGRVPYIQAPNEYPVLTGMLQWFAGLPLPKSTEQLATSGAPFFYATAILLGAAAVVVTLLLGKMVGGRALYFALAPTLGIYGLMNWDLLAVLLATAGTYWYLRREDAWAGSMLGLGAAAKLYPGLMAVPFALGRLREKDRDGALRVAGFAAGAWAVANLPFAALGFENWKLFFTFNSKRGADWDSIWFMIGEQLDIAWDQTLLNLLSLSVFVALAVMVWNLKNAREKDFPAWSFAFPLVVLFLLTNKVYSPQYGLWLLPLFALCLPNLRVFVAFQLADVAVYWTRFRYFAEIFPDPTDGSPPIEGVPFGAFKVAILVRFAILAWAVVEWVRAPADRRAEEISPRLVPYTVDA